MLYLIGLGLNEKGISQQGLEIIKKCKKIYLENYTVDFPYSQKELEKVLKKKVIPAGRNFVESDKLIKEAENSDIALLVYGSPLVATTHISILQEAKKRNIKLKIIHNASIFDAVGETGLQLYKFGKTASMPGFEADSYIDIVKDNLKIKAHSLILIDMGFDFQNALNKLMSDSKNRGVNIDKIVICSRLELQDSKIYYGAVNKLKSLKVKSPFCIIIPGELHFFEEEVLKNFE